MFSRSTIFFCQVLHRHQSCRRNSSRPHPAFFRWRFSQTLFTHNLAQYARPVVASSFVFPDTPPSGILPLAMHDFAPGAIYKSWILISVAFSVVYGLPTSDTLSVGGSDSFSWSSGPPEGGSDVEAAVTQSFVATGPVGNQNDVAGIAVHATISENKSRAMASTPDEAEGDGTGGFDGVPYNVIADSDGLHLWEDRVHLYSSGPESKRDGSSVASIDGDLLVGNLEDHHAASGVFLHGMTKRSVLDGSGRFSGISNGGDLDALYPNAVADLVDNGATYRVRKA
ncbi:hypothetical protein BXZ70DRAFT_500951 [Cristinia sonorae]|uniref:Uncharacterized protein n=1 Tax=Cristinia sonorae TaxID=1940300 RepID=A0A8K0UHR4_9AGAR|nr:hypothetical protein BXZ70DRAFT_500951 [Cristinia sonorae]